MFRRAHTSASLGKTSETVNVAGLCVVNFRFLVALLLTIEGAVVSLANPPVQEGCVIPSGSDQAKAGCVPAPNASVSRWEDNQVRAKVMEVKCYPKQKSSVASEKSIAKKKLISQAHLYSAKLNVETWLKGNGPRELDSVFEKNLKVGKGLTADFTLSNEEGKWVIKEVTNRTSSANELPECP